MLRDADRQSLPGWNVRKGAKALIGVLLVVGACGCGLESDPKLTVTVVITGVPDKAESERIEKSLRSLVGGPVRYTTSSWTGDTLTMELSPVIDVRQFSGKIDFGKVTETQGNTVKVQFAK